MEEEKRKAYSEVVEILKLIENEEKIEKIPFEVIELIKRNSDPEYKPNISKEIPIENQNLMEDTYSILAWIANKYWGENIETISLDNVQEEKSNDNTSSISEEPENVNEVKEVFVYNDIEPETIEADPNKLPVLVENMNWYQKIKMKVIKLLKMIFRTHSDEEGVY